MGQIKNLEFTTPGRYIGIEANARKLTEALRSTFMTVEELQTGILTRERMRFEEGGRK